MRISGLLFLAFLAITAVAGSLVFYSGGSDTAWGDDGELSVAGCIVINEVMYDPKIANESDHEWVELYNSCNETIELIGWNIQDNYGTKGDSIPSFNITSKGFAIIAVSQGFYESYPDYNGTIVYIEDRKIGGNGLGNSGDRLFLRDGNGAVIDALSYGSDTTANTSWMKAVAEGHSMERMPAGGSFSDNANPTPGAGLVCSVTPTPVATPTPTLSPTPTFPPTLTPTPEISPTPSSTVSLTPTPQASSTPVITPEPSPTAEPTVLPTPTVSLIPTPAPPFTPSVTPEPVTTPIIIPDVSPVANVTPTPSPTPGQTAMPSPTPTLVSIPTPTPCSTVASRGSILVNEFMYNPISTPETYYEWIELYNPCNETLLLAGWTISDNGSSDQIPLAYIPSHQFLVVAAKTNFSEEFPGFNGNIVFTNSGIGSGLNNNGDRITLRDSAGTVIDEVVYSGGGDEGHTWERQPAGGDFIDNSNPTPGRGLPPATPVAASTPKATPSFTPVVSPAPTQTPAASLNSTNMSTGTVANRNAVLINEVQNNPFQSGSDSSWEWLELYNPGDEAIEMRGWGITDNHETDGLPYLNLSPGGLAVVAASENFSADFPDHQGTVVFIADGRIGNGLGNGGDRLILKDSAGTTIDELCYGDDDSMIALKFTEVADGHSLERKPCGGQFIDNDTPTPGHCLPEAISYNESVDIIPVLPMSDEDDSVSVKLGQSAESSLPAVRTARASLSTGQQIEQPDTSLRPLLITLASTFLVIFGWMFYRRKAG